MLKHGADNTDVVNNSRFVHVLIDYGRPNVTYPEIFSYKIIFILK